MSRHRAAGAAARERPHPAAVPPTGPAAGLPAGPARPKPGSGPAGGPGPAGSATGGAEPEDRGARRRIPDLAVLPPLLHGTRPFVALRAALGPGGSEPGTRGRHAALTAVPARGEDVPRGRPCPGGRRAARAGSPATPRSAIAWPRSWGPGSAIRPPSRSSSRGRRWPTSGASWSRDETAARVAALAAWRTGRARVLVACVQALLQHTIGPDDLPATPRAIRVGDRQVQGSLLAELLGLGYEPVIEVAGRGEFARRGGIVDVFPPGADLPVRIEFFGDEIDSLRRFDPTDQRTIGPAELVELLPASEFLLPAGGTAGIRARLGPLAAAAPRAPGRGPGPLREARTASRAHGVRDARARGRRRGRGLGRDPLSRHRSRPRRARNAPRARRARRRRRRGRVPLATGRRATARAHRRRRAAPRVAGRVPRTARLEGAPGPGPHAGADLGVRGRWTRSAVRRRPSDPFGWREPVLPPGRSAASHGPSSAGGPVGRRPSRSPRRSPMTRGPRCLPGSWPPALRRGRSRRRRRGSCSPPTRPPGSRSCWARRGSLPA